MGKLALKVICGFTSNLLGTSFQISLVSTLVISLSFTISQPTKKPCKPTALVSQSLETRIYVFNYLPLVLHRLYDPSVLGASHGTDILTKKPLWYLPLGQRSVNNSERITYLINHSSFAAHIIVYRQPHFLKGVVIPICQIYFANQFCSADCSQVTLPGNPQYPNCATQLCFGITTLMRNCPSSMTSWEQLSLVMSSLSQGSSQGPVS